MSPFQKQSPRFHQSGSSLPRANKHLIRKLWSLADSPLDLFFRKQRHLLLVWTPAGWTKPCSTCLTQKGLQRENPLGVTWKSCPQVQFLEGISSLHAHPNKCLSEAFREEALRYQRSGIYQNKNHCQFNKVFLGIVLQQLLSLFPSLKWSQWEKKIARPERGNNKTPNLPTLFVAGQGLQLLL